MSNTSQRLYIHTPLLHSHILSKITGKNIYLKMEALQPSGSFKDRGIGALCQYYASQKVRGFVASSGGNAGMAVAFASRSLNIPATIVIPKSTPAIMVKKLEAEQAKVVVVGENWNAADEVAREKARTASLAYIPPFDHPRIWEGYISLVAELKADNLKPDAILLSVGGGGLYSGVVQGLHALEWENVPVITAETAGAASLAISAKEKKRVHLEKINTIAVTLGAKQICQRAFDWTQKHPTFPQVISDKAAVTACLRFVNDHRLLVEPACGAALSVVYDNLEVIHAFNNIVVVVCGGSGVNLALLQEWQRQFAVYFNE